MKSPHGVQGGECEGAPLPTFTIGFTAQAYGIEKCTKFIREAIFVRSKKSCSFTGYEPKVLSALGSVASCLARVHGFGIASATEQSGFRGPSG